MSEPVSEFRKFVARLRDRLEHPSVDEAHVGTVVTIPYYPTHAGGIVHHRHHRLCTCGFVSEPHQTVDAAIGDVCLKEQADQLRVHRAQAYGPSILSLFDAKEPM